MKAIEDYVHCCVPIPYICMMYLEHHLMSIVCSASNLSRLSSWPEQQIQRGNMLCTIIYRIFICVLIPLISVIFECRSHPPSPSFAHKSPGYEVFAPQSSSRKKRHLPATPCLMHPVGAAAVGRGVCNESVWSCTLRVAHSRMHDQMVMKITKLIRSWSNHFRRYTLALWQC